MSDLIYIDPRDNPNYHYKQVLNDINTNFSGITSGLISLSGVSNDNYFTTGATLGGYTVYFDRNDLLSAYTLDLSSFSGSPDTFITGFTYDNINSLTISRNDGVNYNVFMNSFSASTISGGTFYGDGSQLSGISTDNFYTTGFTYDNANKFTISDNNGNIFETILNITTGLTVNGIISATTIYSNTTTQPTNVGIDGYYFITSNGDGTCSVSANTASFLNNAETEITRISISANTSLSLTDSSINYVVADRDIGAWAVKIARSDIDYIRYIPYAEIYRSGNNLHIQMNQLFGYKNDSKNYERITHTNSYARESGLDGIAVDSSLNITSNAGAVYVGFTEYAISGITTATTQFFNYHSATTWVVDSHLSPIINNTHYDDGVDLISLSPSAWTINYLYRGIELKDHCYTVLGNQEYESIELAQASNVIGSIPELMSSHAMLLGRIIVQSGATSGYTIESAFDTIYAGSSSISDHGALLGLGDDDHTQYHNDARGDLKYPQLSDYNTYVNTTAPNDFVNTSGDTMTGTLYAPSISATSISATTFYGDGSQLTGIASAFTGGTVTGATIFTDGVTANTISATTVNLNSLSATTSATTYTNLVIDNIGNVLSNKLFYIGVNFMASGETFTYVAPEAFKINSIDNPSGITYTTLINSTTYTLGNTISLYSTFQISGVTSTGFLKLNSEVI